MLGEQSLLPNPKPLCLPKTVHIHRSHLSPASMSGSGLPPGDGIVLSVPLWGHPGELGQCLPASSTHQPGSGRVEGSRASSSSSTSRQGGGAVTGWEALVLP